MENAILTETAYKALIEAILSIIIKSGMKGTTMDKVATSLSMSKRTLYKIFGSKEDMLEAVIKYNHQLHMEALSNIVNSSETVIEIIYRILQHHHRSMHNVNVEFIRDMDTYYNKLRSVYEKEYLRLNRSLQNMIARGIEQGVLVPDINYPVVLKLLRIQIESLKRMEEFFPPDITLEEAYRTICISFVRSIATPKGLEIIQKYINSESP